MSGPTTAIFVGDPITVLVSAAAIRAAQAVAAGYENAAILRDEQHGNREKRHSELNAASIKGREQLKQAVQTVEAEFDDVMNLAKHYAAEEKISLTRPAQPDQNNEMQVAAYINGMQTLIKELREILLTESALRMDNLDVEVGLDAAIEKAAQSGSINIVQRLLSRIAHLGELPQNISNITKEISDAPFLDSERAKLLLTELRLQIQTRVEAAQKQAVQEATALILQQSLKDLGYQVEDVSSTLFVEGGVVHFRRQGWGEHMVRMRVDPKNSTTNFNVVRAVETNNNEQSVLDHLAEDRWCAEFPALLAALDVRGVHLNVTRRLEAGELPVQLVQKDKLPQFTEAENQARNAKLNTLKIK
jgi:vacuolar-type H+-ATPase subunit H